MITGSIPISQFPTGTSIFGNDVFIYSHGITGSAAPITQRGEMVLLSDYMGNFFHPSGTWAEVSDTWTYATTGTITVPFDATLEYRKGGKIRFRQGGSYKYMSITSVATGTLSVFGGSDYQVANSAITNPAYSPVENPIGFPNQFNFTPSWAAGITVGNATVVGKISINGERAKGNVSFKFPAAAPTCAITGLVVLTPPIPVLSTLSTYTTIGAAACIDWGTALYMGESVYVTASNGIDLRIINVAGTYAVWTTVSSTVPFTWGVDDLFTMEFSYFI